jgi:hypothetical protein
MDLSEVVNQLSGVETEITQADDIVLDGLGRVMKLQLNPAQKLAVNSYANLKVQQAFKSSVTTPGQRYLVSKASELSEQSKKNIFSGKSEFIEREYYLRRKLSAATDGIQKFIEPSDRKVTGIQNYNEDKLSESEDTVISAIKLSYGFSASVTANADDIAYSNSVDAETGGSSPVTVPNGILNGEVEILVNDKIAYSGSIKRFFRDSLSVCVGVEGSADAVQLRKPLLVKKGENIQVIIRASKNAAVTHNATNNHYMEVKFFCDAVKAK